jgi:hypothetical protein
MTDPWLQQLAAWHNFYLLLGPAAATLTGLMFVVVSLGPQLIAAHTATGVRAFVTPAVVYFTTVLVVAALMTVPAVPAPLLGALLALGSLGGLCYLGRTGAQTQWRQAQLDRRDWLWYVGLPIGSYLLLLGVAVGLGLRHPLGLASVAGAVLLLLVIGIRNAWDVVLVIAQQHRT